MKLIGNECVICSERCDVLTKEIICQRCLDFLDAVGWHKDFIIVNKGFMQVFSQYYNDKEYGKFHGTVVEGKITHLSIGTTILFREGEQITT